MMLALPPQVPNYNPQEVALTQQRLQAGRLGNQTALLELDELRRQQASAANQRQFLANNPDVLLGGGGGSLLGSLHAGPPGAITQGPLPGQAGPTQTIGAPQDLSQYASGPPPQSTLGSLQGAPQPQDPVRALMQQDPEAALKVLDTRYKVQERVLSMQEKKMAAFGQILQGATDQASWDQAREQIRQVDPQAAARMSPFFSAEERDRWVMQAQSVKDSLTQRLEARKLDVLLRGQDIDIAKIQRQGGELSYQTDANGNIVAVPKYAGDTGGVQSRPVLGSDGQPIRSLEGQRLTADQQKHIAGQEGQLRTHLDTLLKPYYEVRDAIGRIESAGEPSSAAGDLALITAFMKMLDPTTGVRDVEFRNAATAGGFVDQIKAQIARVTSGERLSEDMRKDLMTRARKLYEQYEKDYGQVKQQYRDLTTRLGGNPANVVLESGSTAAQPSTPRASGPPSPAPAGGKVVSRAALHAEADRRGVSREQAEVQARQKGYEVR